MTTKEATQEITSIIIRQLGGMGKLRAMVNARNFMIDNNPEEGIASLHFQFSGSRKAKKCIITLLADDTYRMTLGKVNRNLEWKEHYNESGLYWDMLIPEFERETELYLSL